MELNYQILDFDPGGYAQMCVWDWLLIGLFDPSQSIANRWTSAPRYKRDVTPVEAQNKASNHGPHTHICADPPDCKSENLKKSEISEFKYPPPFYYSSNSEISDFFQNEILGFAVGIGPRP